MADQGWRVYSLDLLGFGQSAQPARPMDNRLWALQVCAFLDQVVQGPAVVIGNSLGGLTALTAAVLALGHIGDPAYAEVLTGALKDPDVVTRLHAVQALAHIADTASQRALIGVLEEEADDAVLVTTAKALRAIYADHVQKEQDKPDLLPVF